jgi:diacylglycerol kinase family enzyme
MSARRPAAIVSLAGGAIAAVLAAYLLVVNFPRGAFVFVGLGLAIAAAWLGLLRQGSRRWIGLSLALALFAAAAVVLVGGDYSLAWLAVVLGGFAAVAGARTALRPDRSLPPAPPPHHAVLFVNPRSGEGRAEEAGLADSARQRGIEVTELGPGDDLEELVRAAVGRGADGLAMAGGDGSQALVAAIAAEHDLPYACIPAGTRNHFALDLGVDREDVVGALDAFVDGGERLVDLGEVNGRVFVNNVSLGVYAEAVSQEGYREAKLRTLLDTLSGTLGPEGETTQELRWRDADGVEQVSTALILVSNNQYRLGPTLGSGTRPKLDDGLLGVIDFHPPIPGEAARWQEIETAELEIEATGPVPLGIDGESVTLDSPLRFRVRPRALRVRIARDHPGASPSAEIPKGFLSVAGALLAVALARPEDHQRAD